MFPRALEGSHHPSAQERPRGGRRRLKSGNTRLAPWRLLRRRGWRTSLLLPFLPRRRAACRFFLSEPLSQKTCQKEKSGVGCFGWPEFIPDARPHRDPPAPLAKTSGAPALGRSAAALSRRPTAAARQIGEARPKSGPWTAWSVQGVEKIENGNGPPLARVGTDLDWRGFGLGRRRCPFGRSARAHGERPPQAADPRPAGSADPGRRRAKAVSSV